MGLRLEATLMRWTSLLSVRLTTLSVLFASAALPGFCGETATSPAVPETETTGSGAGGGNSGASGSVWEKDPSAWKISIYPVYLWAPVFGAHINFTGIDLPNTPGTPSSNDGSTSGSFNGAGFAAFEIEKSRFVARGETLFASVSGDNTNPKVHIGMNVLYGAALGGYKITRGLSLEGGFRYLGMKISGNIDDRPGIVARPGVTDPLIGLTWNQPLGRRWMMNMHFDGGGFGVGSDVDMKGSVRFDWRFAKHFGLAMGAAALHLQIEDDILSSTQLARTVKFRQTLWGPVFGFGIYF
jgi:hypothetical protein